jgi:hypothetical protein
MSTDIWEYGRDDVVFVEFQQINNQSVWLRIDSITAVRPVTFHHDIKGSSVDLGSKTYELRETPEEVFAAMKRAGAK